MLAEIALEELAATLDRCVDDTLWEAGVVRPPVDAFRVAERLGVVVAQDASLPTRGRVVRHAGPCGGETTIVLAREPRPERRHWAVAHELGETRAYRVFAELGVDPRVAPPDARERIANALAGRFLAPTAWLRRAWHESRGDLTDLKSRFSTASYELLGRRLLESLGTPLVVTVTDNDSLTWRRWNNAGRVPPLCELERLCIRHAHAEDESAYGDGRDEPDGLWGHAIARVRCYPVHEPGWRREVTITELMNRDNWWT